MKIIVDAMGGDNAPSEICAGAIEAAEQFGYTISLVGRVEVILKTLADMGISLPKGVEIVNAADVIGGEESPTRVVVEKKDSSMVVGLKLLADGGGDAFVSAGSTGALLSAATLIVKRVKGIRRAAMAPVVPTMTGNTVIIDCGANSECTPEYLLQFAFMGAFYSEKILGVSNPRVGLLNIGSEPTKGGELQVLTYNLLVSHSAINFVGNVEARDVMLGAVDVVVCDGFSGNVLLKAIEGTALFINGEIKKMFTKSIVTKAAAVAVKSGISEFKKKLDYRETGGTALIGISKPVIKAHGSSDALAIKSAIRQAAENAAGDVAGEIERNIEYMKVKS